MIITHRPIPELPKCERVKPIAGNISRSYPVGHQHYLRVCQGESLVLTIRTTDPIPANIMANLITTINSDDSKTWQRIAFENKTDRLLVCEVIPQFTGLFGFRAEFSLDDGNTWLSDHVADSWLLVDPPQVDRLLMYTIIPTISGSISDWKKEIHRIKAMGFNAIHLLPITLLDDSESPYAAKDLFELDPSYIDHGNPNTPLSQLSEFVEEAKRNNIRLCFDLVLNHVGIHSKICKQAPDWIVPDPLQPDGFQRARYLCDQGWFSWNDLALINYEHPSTAIRSKIWSYMKEYALFWAHFASQTNGFLRFDNLHSSNAEFVEQLTITLQNEYPNVAILAEYFTDETTLQQTVSYWRLNLILATPWDYKFVPQLRDYLSFLHRMSKQVRYFMPVTSHDSGTPTQEFGGVNSTIPRYVAAALMGTGATGLIQGVEYGEPSKINFIGRSEKKKFSNNAVFESFIVRVNHIFNDYEVFRKGGNCIFVDHNHESIIAAYRESFSSNEYGFLVVCNFDIFHGHTLTFDLSSVLTNAYSYPYHELIGGFHRTIYDPIFELHLPPCTAQVLRFYKE